MQTQGKSEDRRHRLRGAAVRAAVPAAVPAAGLAVLALLSLGAAALVVILWWTPGGDRLDRGIQRLMAAERLPSGVVALAWAGQPLDIRGYDLAQDSGAAPQGRALDPATRFRLASLTKPAVAAAVVALAADGRLDLDAPLWRLLPDLVPSGSELATATLRDLLRHSAGWDRAATFDPYFLTMGELHARLGLESSDVTDCRPLATAMAARPLQFAPGRRYAYSNLGYCWLGLVLERATGDPWFAAVQALVPETADLGLSSGVGEAPPARIAGTEQFLLHRPEVLGSAGGLSGTAEALVRFARRPVPVAMRQRPPYASAEDESFYGLGWRVWQGRRSGLLTHYGAMPGAFSLLARHDDGRVAVALFNARPADDTATVEALLELFGF